MCANAPLVAVPTQPRKRFWRSILAWQNVRLQWCADMLRGIKLLRLERESVNKLMDDAALRGDCQIGCKNRFEPNAVKNFLRKILRKCAPRRTTSSARLFTPYLIRPNNRQLGPICSVCLTPMFTLRKPLPAFHMLASVPHQPRAVTLINCINRIH